MTATPTIPRPVLFGAFALVGLSLAGATVARFTGPLPSDPAPSKPVAARELRFVDEHGGAVDIYDAATGATVETVKPGTDGFLRGLMRGLVRTRKQNDDGTAAPFLLTAWADGRITLDDTATNQRVDLEAFGPTNAAVFARLLDERRGSP